MNTIAASPPHLSEPHVVLLGVGFLCLFLFLLLLSVVFLRVDPSLVSFQYVLPCFSTV